MLKSVRRISLAVGLAAAAVSSAFAFSPLAESAYPKAITGLTKFGMTPVKQFDTEVGYRGWLLKDGNGQHTLVFTVDGTSAVVAGALISATGENLTEALAKVHLPKPDRTKALAEFANAASVIVGDAKAPAEITILVDPNCGYCKIMHQLVMPAIEAGELRVRYVPVAILGADSPAKAAGLLASKNPLAAMNDIVQKRYEPSNDKELLAKVERNSVLMRQHGFGGTPAVLYKDKAGNVYAADGVPQLSAMFKALEISGQMDKLKGKPDLARFVR